MASAGGSFGQLVDELAPLANKQRGMRIEADEWNALVGVVRGMIELEGQQEAGLESELKEGFAPRVHAHTGEISISSLDPELQVRLATDGTGVATRFSLADMQSKLAAAGSEIARLSALAEDLQARLDRASADNLDRASKLRSFEARFTSVEDLRPLVGQLTNQVGALAPGIDAAVKLRDSLGGVDVAALQNQIGDLKVLRDNLTGADGAIVRLRDVQAQIGELQDSVKGGTIGGLDERFNQLQTTLGATIDTRVTAGLQETRDATAAQITDARSSLESQLGARLDATRTELAAAADTRAATDRAALESSFTARLDGVSADLRATVSAETATQVDSRLSGLQAQISDAARGAVAAATPALREEVTTAVNAGIETRLSSAEATFGARADALDARFAERDAALGAQIGASVAQELPQLVNAGFAQTSDTLAAQLGARVDQQLAQARDSIAATLDQEVTTSVTAALGDLNPVIAAQVSTQLDALKLDARLTDLSNQVVTQLRGELSDTATKLRTEIAASSAGDQALLRAEIGVARDDAVKVSLDRITTVETAQQQLAARVDASQRTILAQTDALVTARVSTLDTRVRTLETTVRPVVGTPARTTITQINRPVG